MAEELVHIDLGADELAFLDAALSEWGGPARPDDAMAAALGFDGAAGVPERARALRDRLRERPALSREDWRTVLLSSEIVFASDVVGSGLEWPTTTGHPDGWSIAVLRQLQATVGRALHGRAADGGPLDPSGTQVPGDPRDPTVDG